MLLLLLLLLLLLAETKTERGEGDKGWLNDWMGGGGDETKKINLFSFLLQAS